MTAPFLPTRWLISGIGPDQADDPDVFPFLKGQSFLILKGPRHRTKIDESVSGRERRRALWSYPIWRFRVAYEYLRDDLANKELQRVLAFYNSKNGSQGGFFYFDHNDHAVSGQPFGTGDGSSTTFQLSRSITIGGISFQEPIRGLNGAPLIYDNGVLVGTNLISYSEQFDNAAWVKFNCSASANTTVAPDSNTTADSMLRTATGNHYLFQQINGAFQGQQVTFSVWLKAGSLSGDVRLAIRDGTGAADFAAANVTPTGTWTRFSVTGTLPVGAANNMIVYIDPLNDAGSAGDSLILWGGQVEFGAAPGTYQQTLIPYSYTIGELGQIVFTSPPPSGHALSWSGSFFFLCRFENDDLDIGQIAAGLWQNGGLDFRSYKP